MPDSFQIQIFISPISSLIQNTRNEKFTSSDFRGT